MPDDDVRTWGDLGRLVRRDRAVAVRLTLILILAVMAAFIAVAAVTAVAEQAAHHRVVHPRPVPAAAGRPASLAAGDA